MEDIVVIGAGDFGREVMWLIRDINKINKVWNILGFIDDNESIQGSEIDGYKIIGNINWLKQQKLHVVIAISNPRVKKKIISKLVESRNSYPILIHPSVICSNNAKIDEGSIICAGNILSINNQIGKHVIVNLACTIGHDVILGDYTTVSPGVNLSGFVSTEECVDIGTGTAIIQGVTVGKGTIIGAGSVVIKDMPPNCTAVGSPAKPIKFHSY